MEWSALRGLGTEPGREEKTNGLPLLEMVCTLSWYAGLHFWKWSATFGNGLHPLLVCSIPLSQTSWRSLSLWLHFLTRRISTSRQKVSWRMMTGTPPEYRRSAPDFLSQVAPPGSVLAEPHEASVEGQLLVVCSSPTLAGAQLMSIAFDPIS